MIGDSKPRNMHLVFLETVRALELDAARKYLPASLASGVSRRLLEVGAGTGVQARRLSELGYTVTALDVRSSSYRNVRCFDILEYDGIKIPLSDNSYHIVFSSHVLEHVVHLDKVLKEMHRVLAADGVCVHLIPTSSCRAWTLAAHYIWLIRRVIQKLMMSKDSAADNEDFPRMPTTIKSWFWTLFPPRHGERGNTVSEIYYYSHGFWRRKFDESNFQVVQIDCNCLFYTMANAVGPAVSMKSRRFLARFLGSACSIYVLKKKG